MHAVLDSLNLLVSLASAMFGVIALVRPAALTRSSAVGSGEIFYARMYAARSVCFGPIIGILPFSCPGIAVACLLFTAAAVQLADFAIGVGTKERGMMIGPPIAAIIHVLCGLSLL